jgi:Immunoglobulin-like domain of bacterial spore germination
MTAPARMRLAVLASVALTGLSVLAGCADEEPQADDPNPVDTSSSSPSEPTEDPTSSGSPSSSGSPEMVTVPVYFVADTPIGTRLFREFRQVESDNPLAEAVALMTAGDALDPDYSSLYDGAGFEDAGYSEAGQVLVARVADDSLAERPEGMTAREAKLAVQQLVHTMQGVQGERLPVIIQDANGPTTLFGLDSSEGFTAAKQLDVLGFVNVTSPEEGATVADTFKASGVASSFEATVPWEVRDGSGAMVVEGFATAEGWVGRLYPWETEVDVSALEPGTYTFVAMTDDPSDGEGAGPTEDTKTIVVE